MSTLIGRMRCRSEPRAERLQFPAITRAYSLLFNSAIIYSATRADRTITIARNVGGG